MALKKDITLNNGIVVSYHRVVSITNSINLYTMIEVGSYLSEEFRQKEKEWYKNNKDGYFDVFMNTTYHQMEYNKEINVDNVYEYLKTLDIFEGSEDVFETIELTQEETPEESTNNEEN